MPTKFSSAPEVAQIARPLIREFHAHLINARVEYVFRDDVPTQKGHAVWGTARKVSSLAAFLVNEERGDDDTNEPFFVICISEPIWKSLSDDQKTALVDHELMHCNVSDDGDGNPKLSIIGHDFEGFNAEISRYGLWRPNAEKMAKAMKTHLPQQELPLENVNPAREVKKRTTTKILNEKLSGVATGNIH